jgi:hypothetical protein
MCENEMLIVLPLSAPHSPDPFKGLFPDSLYAFITGVYRVVQNYRDNGLQ